MNKNDKEDRIRQLASRRKDREGEHFLTDLMQRIRSGDRYALSQGITLLESNKNEDRLMANALVKGLMVPDDQIASVRVGITGVPGVGKSTFIESFGSYLISKGKKVAILAIDPSSSVSKGSILGDKTRMEKLSRSEEAFIRPTASGGALGGVARATKESIVLCEAAGFDIIIVETVGVGQSETSVHAMVDFFMLLMLAGAGDELQGIKRGIMEMADALIINKADGDNLMAAKRARTEYAAALHLFPPRENGWIPKVDFCSALKHEKIDVAWDIIESYHIKMTQSGYWLENRKEQSVFWMYETIKNGLTRKYLENEDAQKTIDHYKKFLLSGEISPFQAAEEILDQLTS